jgi:hypothetical protein
MSTEHRALYNSLLKSEDLFELDSNFTGVWEEDKKRFIDVQNELEYLTDTPLFEDDEEDEEQQEDIY